MQLKTELPKLIGTIYDASIKSELWPSVLKTITELSGCKSSCFLYQDPITSLPVMLSYGIDQSIEKTYNEHYCKLDRSFEMAKKYGNETGQFVSSLQSLPNNRTMIQEWGEEFYYDYVVDKLKVNEAIGTIINQKPSELSLLGIHRDKLSPAIDRAILDTLQELTPHILRAQKISHKLMGLSNLNNSLYESMQHLKQGVILIDSQYRPLFINASAEKMIAQHPHIEIGHRGLECKSYSENIKLNELLTHTISIRNYKNTSGGGSLLIGKNELTKPLSLMVSPVFTNDTSLPPFPGSVCAMVLINDMGEKIPVYQEFLSEYFGLTPSESKVATAIANGKSLEEIATKTHISIHTVRNQLKAIFSKTDTHRQTDLVKLLLGISIS